MNTRTWLVLMIALISSIGTVHADPGRPALNWSRAANASDCIDPRTLAELVETYTGPVLMPPRSADFSIEGMIERGPDDAYSVRISVTLGRGRPEGDRVLQLRAADCRKLDGAIALIVATTIDPALGTHDLPSELGWLQRGEVAPEEQLRTELDTPQRSDAVRAVASSRPVAASAELQPSAAAVQAGARSSPADEAWEIGLAGSVGNGPAEVPTAGGLLVVGRGLAPWFALAGQLRADAAFSGRDIDAQRSLTAQSLAIAPLACFRGLFAARLLGQACIGPEVGWLRVQGRGFSEAHNVVRAGYGGVGRVELRFEIEHGLWISAGGLLALEVWRPQVTYWDLDTQRLALGGEQTVMQVTLGLSHTF